MSSIHCPMPAWRRPSCFCSGQGVFSTCLQARRAQQLKGLWPSCAIEQLLPHSRAARVFPRYWTATRQANEMIWCQEEPQNQGRLGSRIRHRLQELAGHASGRCITAGARAPAGRAPPPGLARLHQTEQRQAGSGRTDLPQPEQLGRRTLQRARQPPAGPARRQAKGRINEKSRFVCPSCPSRSRRRDAGSPGGKTAGRGR